jgi:hypothetical protein
MATVQSAALYWATPSRAARPSDEKAIVRPSGDQAGADPNSEIWRGVPPRAGCSQIPPRRMEW